MALHLHFLLILFFSFVLLPALGQQAGGSDDLRSLLEFKKGFHDDPSGLVLASWNPASTVAGGCPSSWHGVACDGSGAVVGVALDGLGLDGNLKFATLLGMRSLRNLSLSGNNFTGRLVPAIGAVTSLQHLDLSGNHFYGPIPERITELWGLVYLNLSHNGFTGVFPSGLWKQQQLRVLDLKSNALRGDIGVLLSELRNVEHLDLSHNEFYGGLSMGSSNLSSLANTAKHVNLSSNKLSGVFFTGESLQLFKNLEILDVGDNLLTGELPSFEALTNLRVLHAGRNQLYGSLPLDLVGSTMALVELDLSGNGFSESTPRRHSPLSLSQRLKITVDIARCLSYLHNEMGMPHGNLKPANVLLAGPDLTAKLTDYCLHRLTTPNGTSEQMLNLGALGYGAPELAAAIKPFPSFKADVYAFGVIMMELLTRRSAGDIISGQSGAVDLTDWVRMCVREGRGIDCFDRDITGLEDAPKAMDELLAVSFAVFYL